MVSEEGVRVSFPDSTDGPKALSRAADRQAMRFDLLLALASIVVVFSPCLIEALREREFEREKSYRWNSQNSRLTL
jgi:hypothetical protein